VDTVVGIDLGTTFSAVAYVDPSLGRSAILPDPETQERITPSVVMFDDTEHIIVGQTAKQNAIGEPSKIVEFVKRSMGKPKGDPPAGWQFRAGDRTFSAQEVSAYILKKLKQDAERRLGQPVTKAVITVPAYFGEPERAATSEAAQIAGLDVLAILDEPMAAALAYGLTTTDRNQTVFVFDLGGGTFDVTIIEINDRQIRELAIDGDHLLGGKDWDDELIKFVAGEFRSKFNSNPLDDPGSYQDLQLRVVQAKIELSRRDRTKITVHFQGKSLSVDVTREKFEQLTTGLVARCRALCEEVLVSAHKTWQDIDTVLLVGGSTRLPMIARMVEQISRKTPSVEINPDECVAQGAAWHGAMLQMKSENAARAEWQIQNPGLAKTLDELKVQLVTAHDYGTIAYDAQDRRRSFHMLPRFTPVPFEKTNIFTTRHDNQTMVSFTITEGGLYQGANTCDPDDCTATLGELVLGPIPARPVGSPIEVRFRFNTDKIFQASAVDLGSGVTVQTEIKHPGGLTDAEKNQAARFLSEAEVTS
jgi:molecular chaperone DnaK